jgi:hypothetical protein
MKNLFFAASVLVVLASCNPKEKRAFILGQERGNDTTIIALKFNMPNAFIVSVFTESRLSPSIEKFPTNSTYLPPDKKGLTVYIPTTKSGTRFLVMVTDVKNQKTIMIESKTE